MTRVKPHPDGVADRGERLPGLQVRVMRALEQAEVLVVATEHECRRREQFEVAGLEWRSIVGTLQ